MMDLVGFETCMIPRSKTAAPELLDLPEVVRPFMRAWWEQAGCPTSGPVFPVRQGARAGQRKARMNSYAERLRRDLFRAGVCRLPPIEVPLRKQGMRTDLGKHPEGTMLAPNPADPLYYETRDVSARRLPLLPALVQHGARLCRRQRPEGNEPGRARRPEDPHEVRAPDARDAHDPGGSAAPSWARGNSWQFTSQHPGSPRN